MILTPEEAVKMGLIKGLIDPEKQLQQAGIDLTLKAVHIFEGEGIVDFDNTKRRTAPTKELPWDDEGKIRLGQGAYKITLNERIELPNNVIGIFFPRTTLLRSGVSVFAGLWDPGFEGWGEMLLSVQNPYGIVLYRNARVGQLMFIKENKEYKPYQGVYKG
ncbi:MAG: deoxyuridine 5'-triphosphate nucleotidohydrolase [Candidatus Micrarchaeota archaeon]|nr:deoxyuridine 5'-triphosphate nucleotidohydrolase [Candidatus Micrarchaeota archaeon]